MPKLFFTWLAMLVGFFSNSQVNNSNVADEGFSSGSMNVTAITPLNYIYASEQDFLQPKILFKSVRIDLTTRQKSSVVSAQINFLNGVPSAIQDKFSIKLSQTNSPDVSTPSDFVLLSSSPAFIFMQPKPSRGRNSYSYYFDLKLDPPTNFQSTPVSFYYILYTLSLQ